VTRWSTPQRAFVSLEHPLAIVSKDAGESGPRNDTKALLKEQNHNFAEQFKDIKWIAK